MTRTHYQVLQVSPDASRAEIRTAYRAACLRTHPDKAKPEDKKNAENEFRRVQQAYEVLSDDEKRKAYDYQRTNSGLERTFQHPNGSDRVWPQQPQQHQHPFFPGASSSRGRPRDPFSHPFFTNDDFFPRSFPFGRSPFASFGWPFGGGRDPFEDMMSSHRRMADELSRMATQFQSATAAAAQSFPPPPPQPTEPYMSNHPAGMWSFMGASAFNAADGGPGWVSESRSESWINGQRQTTHRRRDANGVEHVTHSYPDGTTRYLVNGVEQQQQQQQQQQPLPPTGPHSGPRSAHSDGPSRNRRH